MMSQNRKQFVSFANLEIDLLLSSIYFSKKMLCFNKFNIYIVSFLVVKNKEYMVWGYNFGVVCHSLLR